MKTIDIKMFDSLPKRQKADIVQDFGIYLMDFKSRTSLSALYSLSDFYVEVVYQRKGMKLVAIRSYSFYDELDKYLQKIDISGLINGGVHTQ